MKGKSKSSHDLLKDDPRLSAVPAVNKYLTNAFTCVCPLSLLALLSDPTFLYLQKGKRRERQPQVAMKYVKTLLGFLIFSFLSLVLIVCLLLQSGEEVDGDDEVEYDSDERERMRELISKKLQRDKGMEKVAEVDDEERGKKPSRRYNAAIIPLFLVSNELDIFLSL